MGRVRLSPRNEGIAVGDDFFVANSVRLDLSVAHCIKKERNFLSFALCFL